MKQLFAALRIYAFFTVLLGLLYPLVMTAVGQAIFPEKANGSLIHIDGQTVGSILISQKFESPRYFWPRPSAVDFNPLSSGGSNAGPISGILKKTVSERAQKLKEANGGENNSIPQDLLFASGSGLDPEISPEAAYYQLERVAKARGVDSNAVAELIKSHVQDRQFGFLGEPRVNVLKLNLALDRKFARQ